MEIVCTAGEPGTQAAREEKAAARNRGAPPRPYKSFFSARWSGRYRTPTRPSHTAVPRTSKECAVSFGISAAATVSWTPNGLARSLNGLPKGVLSPPLSRVAIVGGVCGFGTAAITNDLQPHMYRTRSAASRCGELSAIPKPQGRLKNRNLRKGKGERAPPAKSCGSPRAAMLGPDRVHMFRTRMEKNASRGNQRQRHAKHTQKACRGRAETPLGGGVGTTARGTQCPRRRAAKAARKSGGGPEGPHTPMGKRDPPRPSHHTECRRGEGKVGAERRGAANACPGGVEREGKREGETEPAAVRGSRHSAAGGKARINARECAGVGCGWFFARESG